MPDLSILITARREQFLRYTVEDVLANARGDTEIICVLDGDWADPPIADHPRVTLVYRPVSIGQRAGVNLAAQLARGTYVMKLDAHCALAEGFDVALMQADRELDRPDATQIPAMINLHVFNWRCRACGRETYQGPRPMQCVANDAHDRELARMPSPCGSAKGFDQVLVWQPRRRRAQGNGSDGEGRLARTDFWRFDDTLHFQYKGPIVPDQQDAELADVMSSVGACFFMRRDRFVEIGGLDESHGSWGNFGTEIACKSWLSGGCHIVNRRTWFAHLFRTQGRDFGFPYPMDVAAQDYARRYSQNLWYGNNWPQQMRPLSWLIDHFAPVRGWHEPDRGETADRRQAREAVLAQVRAAGDRFRWPSDSASRVALERSSGNATAPVVSAEISARAMPSVGLLYYSDCRGDTRVLQAVRDQIRRVTPADWPIVSVTLQPIDFGLNTVPWRCVSCEQWTWGRCLPTFCEACQSEANIRAEQFTDVARGPLTMFRQILTGLEALDTDLMFFVEHDVLYHASHFQFRPPSHDRFWYNQHRYQVSAEDGRAVHYRCCQTANLCADRQLLIAHYQKRIAAVEAAGGYQRNMGYEPGTNRWSRSLDGVGFGTWFAAVPNIDVRTRFNLSKTRWSPAEFRNKNSCEGWIERDDVPGWGVTRGRFDQFLADLGRSVPTEGAA